jgi:tetratricopeptide (TPR) repeat protein
MLTKNNDQIDMMAELFIDKQQDPGREYWLPPISEEACLEKLMSVITKPERGEALEWMILLYRAKAISDQGKYSVKDRHELIRILEQQGQERTARKLIEEGGYCEKIRDYESAVDFYAAGVRVPKTNETLIYFSLNNLGFCLNFMRRFEEAEKFIRQAIDFWPETYNAWKNLGVSLEWQGQYEEAAECYLKAVRLGQGEPRSQMHLYRILRRHPSLRKIDCFASDSPESRG